MTPGPLDPEPDGYSAAVTELESILREIEDDDVDVDVLADRVARAAALIEFCRDRILVARAAVDDATVSVSDG
jgi:exodeoxyribonuclease VII small subunit